MDVASRLLQAAVEGMCSTATDTNAFQGRQHLVVRLAHVQDHRQTAVDGQLELGDEHLALPRPADRRGVSGQALYQSFPDVAAVLEGIATVGHDLEIDRIDVALDQEVTRALALQAPVAADLRLPSNIIAQDVTGTVTRVEIDPDRFLPDVARRNNVWERR